MNSRSILLAFLCLVLPLGAEPALQEAQADLAIAKRKLAALQDATAAEEGPLVMSVQKLDEQVMAKNRELRALLHQEQQLAGNQKRLLDELASRKGEFEYTNNTLEGYAKGFLNRLQSAEAQHYASDVDALRTDATAAGPDLAAEVKSRLAVLKIGAIRLQQAAGGQLIEGRGVTPSGDILPGNFAIMGPIGVFASSSGETAGLTAMNIGNLGLPSITALEGLPAEQINSFVRSGSGPIPIDATGGKAIEAARASKGFSDYVDGGGIVGYAILWLGGIAILIAAFKLYEINSLPIPNLKTINLILDDLLAHDTGNAKLKAEKIKGLSGKMVDAGVENFYEKRRILEDALLEKLSAIQPRLDRFLPFLALAAAAAPMMGLLGTVLGIMKTFDMMAVFGTGNAKNFSAGIGEALITTAMGLVVAIPVIIIHGMLKSLSRGRFDKAQGVALSILNGTTEIVEKPINDQEQDSDEDEFEETELVPA